MSFSLRRSTDAAVWCLNPGWITTVNPVNPLPWQSSLPLRQTQSSQETNDYSPSKIISACYHCVMLGMWDLSDWSQNQREMIVCYVRLLLKFGFGLWMGVLRNYRHELGTSIKMMIKTRKRSSQIPFFVLCTHEVDINMTCVVDVFFH